MATIPTVALASGQSLPALAFGTWKLDDAGAEEVVAAAIADGYRAVDTAQRYHNEYGVGAGMRKSGVPREDMLVTTKLRGGDQGREQAARAFKASLRNLGVGYVDLYFIHWPLPRLGLFVESWRSLIELRDAGLIRTLGVSNFTPAQIDELTEATGVTPCVNQVELHVGFQQPELRAAMAERGVVVQAWGALGRGRGLLDSPELTGIASRHGVTAAQVALRWVWEQGAPSVAKAADPGRRRQNLDIFGFQLTDTDHAVLASFPQQRVGKDPLVDEEY